MILNTSSKNQLLTYGVLLLALLLRLAISPQFLLVPDETNYWQWSRYLALSYHDHPPMIAWTIWLSTTLFGQTEWAVRLPTIVGISLASLYISLLSARWFSWKTAFHVALVSQLMLIMNGSALIATPDGLLLPCWAGACYHAAEALKSQRRRQWYWTGLWFGLGLLSKYTMVIFLPSLFFTMLALPEFRRALARPAPWQGLLLGCILFTPVIVWNAQNEWATFRHVLYQGGADDQVLFTLRYIGDFFGTQVLLLTPVAFVLTLLVWFRPHLGQAIPKAQRVFLIGMSLPGFLIFLLLAFHVRIYGNWPAPVYLTAIVLIAALFAPNEERRTSRIWKATLITAAALSLPVLLQVISPIVPLPLSWDRTARECTGWRELGQRVSQEVQHMPQPNQTFLFGLRYQYASELAFYAPGQPRTVSINRWTRPNVYDFWFTDAMLQGQDAVGVFEHRGMAPMLAQLFAHSDPVQTIELHRHSPWFGRQVTQTLYLFKGYNFRGGIRWQPTDPRDIRATRKQTGHTP